MDLEGRGERGGELPSGPAGLHQGGGRRLELRVLGPGRATFYRLDQVKIKGLGGGSVGTGCVENRMCVSPQDGVHVYVPVGVGWQVAALEWVRRNISAFGGDPLNVRHPLFTTRVGLSFERTDRSACMDSLLQAKQHVASPHVRPAC